MMITQPFCPIIDRRVFLFGFPQRESELPLSIIALEGRK